VLELDPFNLAALNLRQALGRRLRSERAAAARSIS